MKKLLVGFAALPFLASIAMAGEPMTLNDIQMDMTTAGHGAHGGYLINLGGIYLHYPDYAFKLVLSLDYKTWSYQPFGQPYVTVCGSLACVATIPFHPPSTLPPPG